MEKSKVNWSVVKNVAGVDSVKKFANGELSGRQLTDLVAFTVAAGEVRKALRQRGVVGARALARKSVQ